MKRLLFTIVFSFIGIITVQAQWYIGGLFSTTINKEVKAFSIAPDVGYCFPNTPFSVACAVEYSGTFQSGEAYTHSLIVSPYCRYNICDISERFSLFSDLVFDCDVLEFRLFDIMLCPGVSFNPTEHWSAEFRVGVIGYEWEKVPGDKPNHNFVLGYEKATPSFGIYYNF